MLSIELVKQSKLTPVDRQTGSIMAYAAIGVKGKTKLRFVKGYADGQDSRPLAKRKKKTVNAKVYSE